MDQPFVALCVESKVFNDEISSDSSLLGIVDSKRSGIVSENFWINPSSALSTYMSGTFSYSISLSCLLSYHGGISSLKNSCSESRLTSSDFGSITCFYTVSVGGVSDSTSKCGVSTITSGCGVSPVGVSSISEIYKSSIAGSVCSATASADGVAVSTTSSPVGVSFSKSPVGVSYSGVLSY